MPGVVALPPKPDNSTFWVSVRARFAGLLSAIVRPRFKEVSSVFLVLGEACFAKALLVIGSTCFAIFSIIKTMPYQDSLRIGLAIVWKDILASRWGILDSLRGIVLGTGALLGGRGALHSLSPGRKTLRRGSLRVRLGVPHRGILITGCRSIGRLAVGLDLGMLSRDSLAVGGRGIRCGILSAGLSTLGRLTIKRSLIAHSCLMKD